ncbi:MAG TPA: RodZ domain-containing protein [Burkholderiaceae bacterium]|jgi:cytoskeleton protein RodZ
MSSVASDALPEADAAPARPQTAGQWLRATRQQRGLHIAALAAMLKVPQAKLEALETDRYEDLPDATFARALAKAVCRTLKVDPAPVMALLPRSDGRELHVSLGINEPYREHGSQGEGVSFALLQRPIVWGPVLLLLAAAGVYLMPSHWLERSAEPAAVAASAPASLPEMAAASAPEPVASEASVIVPTPTPVVAAPATTTVAQSASAPVRASSVSASTPAPVKLASPNGQVPLTLKTTAASWVEVVDGSGQTLISKIMPAGEQEQVAGAPPLKVKIGNVAGTQLLLRDKPVDLVSQAKDNVARLELN